MALGEDPRKQAEAKRDLAQRARRLATMQTPEDRERLLSFAATLEDEAAALEREAGPVIVSVPVVSVPVVSASVASAPVVTETRQEVQQQQSSDQRPDDKPQS